MPDSTTPPRPSVPDDDDPPPQCKLCGAEWGRHILACPRADDNSSVSSDPLAGLHAAKYLNPECAEHGCQWLQAEARPPAPGQHMAFTSAESNTATQYPEARPPAPEALREIEHAFKTLRAAAVNHHGCEAKQRPVPCTILTAAVDQADKALAKLAALLSAGGGSAPQDEQP